MIPQNDLKNVPLSPYDRDKSTQSLIKRLSEFRSIGAAHTDTAWIEQAAVYVNEGFANEELLHMIVNQMHWYAVGDKKRGYEFFKSIFDFFAGLTLAILYSPLILICALIIKLTSRGTVLYKQVRIGRYGRPFWIYKFRTMREGAQRQIPFVSETKAPLLKYKDDPRITPIGGWLRRRKLDELPQLFNILKGEMSLVGPRPLTPCDSSTTPAEYTIRFAVKPGLTGLWQATDNTLNDGLKKVQKDCEYVKKRSFLFDLKLLFLTIPVAIKGEKLSGPSAKPPGPRRPIEEKFSDSHLDSPAQRVIP